MKKTILLGILFVSTLYMFGQNNVKVTGMEDMKKSVVDKILAEYAQKKGRMKSNLLVELPTDKYNAAHIDFDSGEILEGTKGRAYFVRLRDGKETMTTRYLTPYSYVLPSGYIIINVKEHTVAPEGYNFHTKKVALFFDEAQDLVSMEGLSPDDTFNWTDIPSKKYVTVFLVCKKK